MNYAFLPKPSDVDTEVQFFAVPASAVACPEAQREAWIWYGDALCDSTQGVFVVGDDGRLTFEPAKD